MEKDPEEKVKRSVSPSEVTSPNKKVRLSFSGKEFRKEIKSPKKIQGKCFFVATSVKLMFSQAFQGFLQLIEENSKHDCILTYLEDGGSALEILQSMDGESTVPPVLIFEIVNHILLQVNARISKYANQAIDWCRYLLSSYVTLINKMLGLSSSAKERVVTLKLLATIVTFSVGLAKSVLLNVNFNPTNLELLTKVHEGKREVRTAFIHFITAFLVDGHFPALVVLLEKKGLMTSIIRDLKFDDADVVVLVITAMKNHILENESVTKTSKMKTFNTAVVRDIVNLYNWKGPEGLSNANNQTKAVRVSFVDKNWRCVHL
jgi:nucleolar pre-ribosomal-associated protein 1